MSRPQYGPTRVSRILSLAYAALLVLACVPGLGWELWSAGFGLVALGVGTSLGSRRWVSLGFGGFALAAALLEHGGGPIELVLLVVLLAILSWDAGQRAVDVGRQMGRAASTARVEFLHGGSSALVGVAATAVAYSIYSVAGGRRTMATGALLLVIATGFALWTTR